MERPRDCPDSEALKTCFRLLALSFFVGGFAQAHDSVLLIVQEMIRPPFLKTISLALCSCPFTFIYCTSVFFPCFVIFLFLVQTPIWLFIQVIYLLYILKLVWLVSVCRCQCFCEVGDGNRRGFVSLQKKKIPSLIFDTVCPNYFLLCNLNWDPSVRLPVCFMPIHMQDIHYLV